MLSCYIMMILKFYDSGTLYHHLKMVVRDSLQTYGSILYLSASGLKIVWGLLLTNLSAAEG
jgi:hypothetical protein